MTFKILGIGSFLPGDPISNEQLSKIVTDSDPQWVKSRTGIVTRHFAPKYMTTSHMALRASEKALKDAGLKAQDLDLIIVATTTPDNTFPSTATKLQGMLGSKIIPSFDLQAVCAGFVYALEVANSMIESGKYRNVLVVGADKMSALTDMKDRTTAVLFGDGAGAVILQKSDESDRKFHSEIYSDGCGVDHLYTDGGISSTGNAGYIQMNGREVYRNAVEKMSASIKTILDKSGIPMSEVAYIVPHQANERIIDSIASRLKLPEEKLIKTVHKYANNSAATIPIALDELKQTKSPNEGDIIVLTALGAGLAWGSCLFSW